MEQQPTSGSWIPNDLIPEILSRLPAKSVGRFRCVSKLWLSITTEPCFIKSFGTATWPSLLFCSKKGRNLFVTSTTQDTHKSFYSSSLPIHPYPMKLPGESCHFFRDDSVHGLICIEDVDSKKPIVWNPTTGQLLVLPKPKMSSRRYMNTFLGYDSVEGKHKVICLPHRKTCYCCRVFTLGSGQESWRTVRTNLKHSCDGSVSGRCINGVIYYLAHTCPEYKKVVVSFHVRSEIFGRIELPSDFYPDMLIPYEGRLAYIGNDTRLWSLEDADNHKWSSQDFLFPLNRWDNPSEGQNRSHEDYQHNYLELKGCTHHGEFIYLPSRFNKSSYIVFYDPVRNSCRRLKFEGLVDKEFGHTKNAFPNHIESLMSL